MTATIVHEAGVGTKWEASGSVVDNFPWTPSENGARAGDIGLVAVVRDRTAGTSTNMATPSGWSVGATSNSAPQFMEVFYRRFADSAATQAAVSPTLPGDSDYSTYRCVVRGAAPASGADLQIPAILVGDTLNYNAPTMPRAGLLLCICLDTWNGGNLNGAPSNGFTKRYYSATIQFGANIGVWSKTIASGLYAGGWPFSGGWGSEEHNCAIGIPDITHDEAASNARSQGWVVY